MFVFIAGKKKFRLYFCIVGPKEPLLYVCAQNGRRNKQILRWCVSHSCIWFGVSSVRVMSSELPRSPSTQMLFCSSNPYAVVQIQFHLYLQCTSFYSEFLSALWKCLRLISCKSLPRHKVSTNSDFTREVWCAVQMLLLRFNINTG